LGVENGRGTNRSLLLGGLSSFLRSVYLSCYFSSYTTDRSQVRRGTSHTKPIAVAQTSPASPSHTNIVNSSNRQPDPSSCRTQASDLEYGPLPAPTPLAHILRWCSRFALATGRLIRHPALAVSYCFSLIQSSHRYASTAHHSSELPM
jgi:hypothetical protein